MAQPDIGATLSRISNQLSGFAYDLAEAETQAKIKEQQYKTANLLNGLNSAVLAKDLVTLTETATTMSKATGIDPEYVKATGRQLLAGQLSPATSGDKKKRVRKGVNLNVLPTESPDISGQVEAASTSLDERIRGIASQNPQKPFPFAVGANQDVATNPELTGIAMDAMYAMSDPSVQQYSDAWLTAALAGKEAAVSQVRGRTGRRNLAAQIDAQIAEGYAALTKQAIQWKITDVEQSTLTSLEHAAAGVKAGPEGLAQTQKEIDGLAAGMKYWTPAQQAAQAEAYKYNAAKTWTKNEVKTVYEGNMFSEEADFSGEKPFDPYQAEAKALEHLSTIQSGLKVEDVEALRGDIRARASQDWQTELRRQDAHDEALDQEMSNLYANALTNQGVPLTNEIVAKRRWYSYEREMQWYAKVEKLEDDAAGAKSPHDRNEFFGMMAYIARRSKDVTDAKKNIFNDPTITALRQTYKEYEYLMDEYFTTEINNLYSQNNQTDPAVVKTAIDGALAAAGGDGLDDYTRSVMRGHIERVVSEAENNGTPLKDADIQKLGNTMAEQYKHTVGLLVNNKDYASRREIGKYGLGGPNEKEINLYEQIGLSIAEDKFASWLFFNNGEMDWGRFKQWSEMSGAGNSVKKKGYDLEGMMKTYVSGPIESVGSLGPGYTYAAIEMVGKTPLPIHHVKNAKGQEEMYAVKTTRQGDAGVPEEFQGTECWYRVTVDQKTGNVTTTFTGPVMTKEQIVELNKERQAQIDENKNRHGWQVSNVQRDEIFEIRNGIAAKADVARTRFGRVVRGAVDLVTSGNSRETNDKIDKAAYIMWQLGITTIPDNWEDYTKYQSLEQLQEQQRRSPTQVMPSYFATMQQQKEKR